MISFCGKALLRSIHQDHKNGFYGQFPMSGASQGLSPVSYTKQVCDH